MSQTICANCGKSHAPQVTTQQAREAKWPTFGRDMLLMLERVKMEALREQLAKGEPVRVNGQLLGVPPIPSWVPANEPVTVNSSRRAGVPDLPPWGEPKAAA